MPVMPGPESRVQVRHSTRDVGSSPTSPGAGMPSPRVVEPAQEWQDKGGACLRLRCDRVGPCAFDLELRSPLSLVQAFGIVLARLDSFRAAGEEGRE